MYKDKVYVLHSSSQHISLVFSPSAACCSNACCMDIFAGLKQAESIPSIYQKTTFYTYSTICEPAWQQLQH